MLLMSLTGFQTVIKAVFTVFSPIADTDFGFRLVSIALQDRSIINFKDQLPGVWLQCIERWATNQTVLSSNPAEGSIICGPENSYPWVSSSRTHSDVGGG